MFAILGDSSGGELTIGITGAPEEGETWTLLLVDDATGGELRFVRPIVAEAEPATRALAIGGTIRVDQVWTLVVAVDDVTVRATYTAAASDTLEMIAAGLAQALLDAGEPGITASASGQNVYVTDRFGREFTASIQAQQPDFATVTTGAETVTARLGGTPVSGELWTVTIEDFFFNVTIPDHLPQIATALADAISADPNYTATASGAEITITRTSGDFDARITRSGDALFEIIGSSTASELVITLTGAPYDGETWKIELTDAGDSPEFEHVVDGLSAGEVAAQVAALINADTRIFDPSAATPKTVGELFSAWVEGDTLVIVNRADEAFDVLTQAQSVTRMVGKAYTSLEYDLSAADVERRLQILYGFDDISVEKTRGQGNVTYIVTFVREQAGIDQPEIEWDESRLDTGLIPSPNASAEVIIETIRDGPG